MRRRAATILLGSRAVYGYNWYAIGGVLPLIGSGLPATTVQLGIVLGAFLVGVGTFQVPAGLAALRWGNRNVSVGALAAMAIFGIASAFSPNWEALAALRFGAGAGAAFFFAPALGLVASYFPEGRRGPVFGLYNAGFGIGAALGVLPGAVLGHALGWPLTLAVGGVGIGVAAVAAHLGLPSDDRPRDAHPRETLRRVGGPVFRSRSLWALAFAFAGFWAAAFIAAQYFVNYASDVHPSWGLEVAAGVTTVLLVCQIVAGPVGGWLGERSADRRRTLAFAAVLLAGLVVAIPFLPLAAIGPAMAGIGIAAGTIFAVMYLVPTYLVGTRGEGVALSLALLNSVQVFVGSGLAVAFAYVAATSGYTLAWIFAGAATVGTLPLLLWVRPTPRTNRAGVAVGETSA